MELRLWDVASWDQSRRAKTFHSGAQKPGDNNTVHSIHGFCWYRSEAVQHPHLRLQPGFSALLGSHDPPFVSCSAIFSLCVFLALPVVVYSVEAVADSMLRSTHCLVSALLLPYHDTIPTKLPTVLLTIFSCHRMSNNLPLTNASALRVMHLNQGRRRS